MLLPRISRLVLVCVVASITLLATPVAADSAAELHKVLDDAWEFEMRSSPTWASRLGDRRYNHQWTDITEEGYAHRYSQRETLLDRLAAIDRDSLSADDQLSLDLAQRRYEDALAANGFRSFLMPLGHRGGVQTLDNLPRRLRFTTAKDYQDWLTRLSTLASYIQDTENLLRQGLEEGRTKPRVLMQRVPAQIRALLVDNPEASGFYQPFLAMPDDIPAAEQDAMRARARMLVTSSILPAFRELLAFFETDYLPGSRGSIAAAELPDGRAYYSHRVRTQTTTSMSADAIHNLGLAEVARIRSQMDVVIAELGFTGSFAEFLQFLRTDPRFYLDSPEALLARYRAIAKQIDPQLVTLFGKLPRMPYGVIAIPDAIAPDTTTAYYTRPAADGSRAGYYYVNLYRPEVRPTYEMEVLSVHEAVPGHHLQIALAMELDGLPKLRRYTGFTAFTEGWGLYSESLGSELGLYQDPYSRFGQLTYEMWRAVRLVVDTGMHAKGWSRQRAIDYFLANAAKTEVDITNEIDRYIDMPGQALAYKIGELTMQRLKRDARTALGSQFDVRAFHDHLLGAGALPMAVLEQRMASWLKAQVAAQATQ